jgi:predicted metalloprotease with PDZ domain
MGPKELNTQVGPLIVHETFHLGNPSSNVPDTWFREGFTTYYQHVIAARLGFLTEDEFVTELCQRSQNHRRVPPVSLEEAGKRMFQDRRCYEDVYTGGALMAFLLDVEMRRRGFSLDEVMLRLYRDYALRGKDFDRAVMGRIVTKISGVNLAEMIDQYVEHDQWPSIESTVRESGYTVEVKTEPYQLGVPLKSVGDDGYKVSSIPSGIDTGLKEGDVIVAVDGKSVHNRDLLMAALKGDPAGDQFQLTIKRGDAMMNIAVTPYRITKVTAHKKEGGDTSVIDAIVSAAHSQ